MKYTVLWLYRVGRSNGEKGKGDNDKDFRNHEDYGYNYD